MLCIDSSLLNPQFIQMRGHVNISKQDRLYEGRYTHIPSLSSSETGLHAELVDLRVVSLLCEIVWGVSSSSACALEGNTLKDVRWDMKGKKGSSKPL